MEFLQTNQMYIVLGVVLLIWAGIAAYLFRLERRIREAEQFLKSKR